MVSALICTHSDLATDLAATPLWRADVERHTASRLDEAHMMAVAARPRIVVVDSALPWAGRLVSGLREDPGTRALSIVVVARGDFDPSEVELLESGANAIVRLPVGEDAGARLQRLMNVPARRRARFSVYFKVDATASEAVEPEPALALNLSLNGMLMETSGPLSLGQDLTLHFRLSDDDAPAQARGRVVRLAGPHQYGVEFTELKAEARGHVQRYLDGLAQN
jgi:DNA-binding response OmpR family regulator